MWANFFQPIPLDRLILPEWVKTNGDLLAFINLIIRPRPNKALLSYMMIDIVQSIGTAIFCAYVMLKKGRARDARLVTFRQSPYGTFIVPNAVWSMMIMITIYLLGWAGFSTYIFYISVVDLPLLEWLFYIPVPWWPLAVGAFWATYGFVLTCSPRSPISNFAGKTRKGFLTSRTSWMHLPLPQSAWIMNSFVVGVTLFMFVWNLCTVTMGGRQRHLSHLRKKDLYTELISGHHTQEWLDLPAPAQALHEVRMAWDDLANVYRWTCAGLASFAALVTLMISLLILYAIPNHISLLDHLVSIWPDQDANERHRGSTFGNVCFLWKIGRPSKLVGKQYTAFKKTYMVTMIGHAQIFLILAGVTTFTLPPFYMCFAPWTDLIGGVTTERHVEFLVAYVISAAFLTAVWVTGLSALLTLDEAFRAVMGADGAASQGSEPIKLSGRPSTSLGLNDVESGKQVTDLVLLRPMQSDTPSLSNESFLRDEKSDIFVEAPSQLVEGKNKVLVETTTTVQIEHRDVEAFPAPADKPEDLPTFLTASPSAASTYGFLGRKRTGPE
ncbi:hypothetical protein PHBOTO_003570 [Pseudozyma hubeiensis]|nr:hypothetical protein PHBOTO_003570 [Pseudozyma hubeiensis]